MSNRLSAILVFLASLLVLVAYIPGLTGALYYDDYSNLDGLGAVVDYSSAKDFVFGGHAGPLGRPVALVSFLPLADGWPTNSVDGFAFNLAIHLANFYLVYFFGLLLLKRAKYLSSSNARLVALSAAFLWAILPLLASTTLILIQRMTGLSAMFGLLGLVLFVYGYRWADRSPVVGVFAQLSALGLGTVLAVFTKESGALIPLFALVVDCFCRDKSNVWRSADVFRRSVLLILLFAVVYQISPLKIDYFAFSDYRGFSVVQRLITEIVVLWEYLFRAFIPQQPTAFGPFHDYYGVRAADWVFFLALGGWGCLLIAALTLRRKAPLLMLAVVWFMVGHLLESTTIMLELYFEHRNYLAIYGFCLLIAWSFYWLAATLGRALWLGFAAYLLVMWTVLFMMTSLWGDKTLAAESWAAKHPGSARAALHAVFVELGAAPGGNEYQDNQRYIARERQDYALRVLDRTMGACPDCIDIRLQALVFACQLDRREEQKSRLDNVLSILGSGTVTPSVISLTYDMVSIVSNGKCAAISAEDLDELFTGMRQNPALVFPDYSGKLYFAQAMMAEAAGDWVAVKSILRAAERVSPYAVPILQYQVYAATQSGHRRYGLEALERRRGLSGEWASENNRNLIRSLARQLDSEDEKNKVDD